MLCCLEYIVPVTSVATLAGKFFGCAACLGSAFLNVVYSNCNIFIMKLDLIIFSRGGLNRNPYKH